MLIIISVFLSKNLFIFLEHIPISNQAQMTHLKIFQDGLNRVAMSRKGEARVYIFTLDNGVVIDAIGLSSPGLPASALFGYNVVSAGDLNGDENTDLVVSDEECILYFYLFHSTFNQYILYALIVLCRIFI